MQSKGFTGVAFLVATLLSGTACSTLNSVKETFIGGPAASGPERISGFIGASVADEPRAALAGREVLALGGSAADAAVAVGMTLAVTLPSRAGLGAGGACVAYDPKADGPGAGAPEVVMFTAPSSGGAPAGADRPAAVPMLARGLFALHARYGTKSFESLLSPAETLARFGVPASRALVRDLALVAGPLAGDPNARAVFLPGGQPLAEGGTLQQPDLGGTLSVLRTTGVGDLYQGVLGRKLEAASRLAGGPLSWRSCGRRCRGRPGLTVRAGRDMVAFLPPPADGGLGAAAAFQALQQKPADAGAAQARAVGAVLRWRGGGGAPEAVLASGASGGTLPNLPASTSFVTLDRKGGAVACAVTMGNLFGTGRIAPGTGILLAASPNTYGVPLLAAAIAWNANVRGFRAAVGGSGQEGAALAVAVGLNNALRSNAAMPAAVPEPGRANAAACYRYLPDSDGTCSWATDPRGYGLAAASN